MTFVEAAPQIQNVLTLVSLILFIYAALGINLFGTVMYRDNYKEQSNFRNIFEAIMLLLRCLTGEDWNAVMNDLTATNSYNGQECLDNQTYEETQTDGVLGCGSWTAYPFFISFFIINALVILDLSIGVFISALEEAKKFQKVIFGKREVNKFVELWSDYDPNGTGWIHVNQLLFLIYEMPLPYGKGKIKPAYTHTSDHDRLRNKLMNENKFLLNTMSKRNHEFYRDTWDVDIEKTENNDIYYVNYAKGLAINDISSVTIVNNYKIPIYEGLQVNFKNVLRQVIMNAFESLEEEFLPEMAIQVKFERKWKFKTKKQLIVENIDEFMVGRMYYNK